MVFRLPRGVTGRITGMGNTYWCFEHSQKISVSWRWRCNYLAGSEYLIKENHSGLPNYSGVSFWGVNSVLQTGTCGERDLRLHYTTQTCPTGASEVPPHWFPPQIGPMVPVTLTISSAFCSGKKGTRDLHKA